MRRPLALLAALLLAGCGYFNSMYNAQRRFSAAENAAAHGQREAASRAWLESIEKAAASYRKHPAGRWADDALWLIARARFERGEYEAARGALLKLLEMEPQGERRAAAQARLGACELLLGNPALASARLDSALSGRLDADNTAFARLWRARVRFGEDETQGAWQDLDAASANHAPAALEAELERARRAVELEDSARLRASTGRLFRERAAARWADSVGVLVDQAAGHFGAAWAALLLDAAAGSDWPTAQRESQGFLRIALRARAGDTTAAITAALELAGRASPVTAGQARALAGRLELARADSITDLSPVRALLLPALNDPDARIMLRGIKTVEVLMERADQAAQPLALFAAAEIARDELRAPRLARQLFLAYADIVPDAIWAPKAMLAAAALSVNGEQNDTVVARLHAHPDNVYVLAVTGGDPDAEAYSAAESRLLRSLTALRDDAMHEADARDVRVGVAIARLDSLEARAAADSLRLACGMLIDSLAINGIRADSVRSACVRRDGARVAAVLHMDTLLLRDSTRLAVDSLRNKAKAKGKVIPDTFALRRP